MKNGEPHFCIIKSIFFVAAQFPAGRENVQAFGKAFKTFIQF
jgi:hypothetical protein